MWEEEVEDSAELSETEKRFLLQIELVGTGDFKRITDDMNNTLQGTISRRIEEVPIDEQRKILAKIKKVASTCFICFEPLLSECYLALTTCKHLLYEECFKAGWLFQKPPYTCSMCRHVFPRMRMYRRIDTSTD